MTSPNASKAAGAVVDRLCNATNRRDIEALVSCFAPHYRNETPAHPARSFQGRAQVRRNWEQIFAAVPDISVTARWIADDRAAWSEMEMRGTRLDGTPLLQRGVVIFEVEDGKATSARFYIEPVEVGGGDVDEAVRRALVVDAAPDAGAAQGRPQSQR